jgi:hypothetical protein
VPSSGNAIGPKDLIDSCDEGRGRVSIGGADTNRTVLLGGAVRADQERKPL